MYVIIALNSVYILLENKLAKCSFEITHVKNLNYLHLQICDIFSKKICERQINKRGITYRDEMAKTPYLVDGSFWVGFDDRLSIYTKVSQ